ncbi:MULTISPECIES: hypothetical protein [Burkholderia]|uniref:hypothetical protein n=1 Tax=Burkholderia TaxID=32008 RepID=UPI001160CE62|nr:MULTISPECIES: hypothetical protein [Burkholderia]
MESNKNFEQCAAELPGRSAKAIQQFAMRHGMEKAEPYEWPEREIEILKRIYASPRAIKESMHLLPGRSYVAAAAMAHRLGFPAKGKPLKGSTSVVFKLCVPVILEFGPLTADELAIKTGQNAQTIREAMRRNHGRDSRIGGWKRTTPHHWAVQWAIGSDPDVPRPEALTKSEQNRAQAKRKKARKANPFLVAAGEVKPVLTGAGREFKQDMTIHLHDELEAA